MVKMTKIALIAAFAVTGLTSVAAVSSDTAEARYRKHHHHYRVCKPAVVGFATGQGILGKGTKEARKDARWDWENKATNAYGDPYGNFDKARHVRWNCKKGAILQAQCIVTARPCLR